MRLPISFKTECDGSTYRHIVLGVYAHTGMNARGVASAHASQSSSNNGTWAWGALGISRRKTLMFKELEHPTLSSLVREYKTSYEGSWHRVLKVYLGLPFAYEESDASRIQWRCLTVDPSKEWASCAAQIDKYSKDCVQLWEYYSYKGSLPEEFKTRYSPRTPREAAGSSGGGGGGGGLPPKAK